MFVTLKTNKTEFKNWSNIQITRSLRAISGKFQLTCFLSTKENINLNPGDDCEIYYQDKLMITGFIDTLDVTLTANEYQISISGRDKSGNCVDSTCINTNKSFKGSNLIEIATPLVLPFRISIESKTNKAKNPIPLSSFQFCESIYETIDKLARTIGVLVYSNEQGNLIFADTSSEVIDTLCVGKNVLEITSSKDASEKFQKYVVVSHSRDANNAVEEVKAESVDTSVKSPRIKKIFVRKNSSKEYCQARSKWEMSNHIAKSEQITMTVPDWITSSKNIWSVNSLVTVQCSQMNLHDNYLINDIEFMIDPDRGFITQIKLVNKNSYSFEPHSETKMSARNNDEEIDNDVEN